MAVHNGILLRKSDEEECVSATLMKAHTWQNEMLFSVGRRHMHETTHTNTQTSLSLYISRSLTHIVALKSLMSRLVLSLPVHLCERYMCGALKTGCICSSLMCRV